MTTDQPRVLHLGFEDPMMPGSGGGSVRTHEINRRLVADGMAVTVLTTRYPGCSERVQDGVRYVPVGPGAGRNRLTRLLGYAAALPSEVRRRPDHDLVVEDFFAPISSMGAPLWTSRPTVGVVQWLHARDKAAEYGLPFHLVERAGVRTHRRLIAVSEGTAARLRTMNPAAHVEVIGNGVDRLAFAQEPRPGRDVVFIGRLETRGKGLDLLLHAWATAGPQLDADLVIAGTGPDEQSLRQLARRLGIADRVRFVGWVSGQAKYELLAGARLVVVPSRQETFGIVAVEALATGTPVVAFDIPCLRELLPPDIAHVVPAFDVDAFASVVVRAHRSGDVLLRMGERGRRAAAAFDWDVLAAQQGRTYRDAVRSRRGSTSRRSVG